MWNIPKHNKKKTSRASLPQKRRATWLGLAGGKFGTGEQGDEDFGDDGVKRLFKEACITSDEASHDEHTTYTEPICGAVLAEAATYDSKSEDSSSSFQGLPKRSARRRSPPPRRSLIRTAFGDHFHYAVLNNEFNAMVPQNESWHGSWR